MVAATRSFESRLDEIARRRREMDAQEAGWLAEVAEYDRSHEWQADGFLSAAAAIRERCRMTHGNAAAVVRFARRLERLPETAAALSAGEISREHAKVIADAYMRERAEAFEAGEHALADAAKNLGPADLRELVAYTVDAIDGDGGAHSDAEQYELNRFHASPLGDRVKTDGSHDKESGEIIITALDAMNAKLYTEGDTRDRSVRRAEALTEICRQSLAHDHDNGVSRSRRGRPQVSIVMDLQRLEADHAELVADIRAESAHVRGLSRNTLERLTCDCEISRVITDGASEIIDVGRKTRNVAGKLWKALVVRDRHCQEQGCHRPPGMCEAHHIWYWSHGGPTTLENLKLLCWSHHRKLHIEECLANRRRE